MGDISDECLLLLVTAFQPGHCLLCHIRKFPEFYDTRLCRHGPRAVSMRIAVKPFQQSIQRSEAVAHYAVGYTNDRDKQDCIQYDCPFQDMLGYRIPLYSRHRHSQLIISVLRIPEDTCPVPRRDIFILALDVCYRFPVPDPVVGRSIFRSHFAYLKSIVRHRIGIRHGFPGKRPDYYVFGIVVKSLVHLFRQLSHKGIIEDRSPHAKGDEDKCGKAENYLG